jgi:hypothetical protein
MLRVSDGKWKQDISIFVQNTSSTASSLFPLSGNYIAIDSGGKRLTSYVENVVQYSNDVFEIFIQRDIVKSIEVGATVSYSQDGIIYSGNILLAPKLVKVLKPGKGFKVGDIFSLRTNTGEGCKIKVTQVDGNGGILKVKIIKFSLDYNANFWSYLNAKDGAVPVPQSFSESGGIQTLTLADIASSNINESGIISRQNYMFYDTSIPTAQESQGANRFFADTSYVGQVDFQIYADNIAEYKPENLALIEVQVGACSVYSGYYLSQDGFISDEIYIQDSNYYQAFSYVIKVEEELRKYADLVKTILHPAGMKMFAEFQVYNKINVSATSVFKNRVIQISDSFNVYNQGIGYSEYDVSYGVNGEFIHTPKPGAEIIFTPFNTIAHILGKKIYPPSESQVNTNSVIKFVDKNIPDFYSINEQYPVKLVHKPFSNQYDVSTTSVNKLVEKPLEDDSTIDSNVIKTVQKPFSNQYDVSTTSVNKLVEKPFSNQYDVSTTSVNKLVEKQFNNQYNASTTNFNKVTEKTLDEQVPISSLPSKLLQFAVKQSFYVISSSPTAIPGKVFENEYSLSSLFKPLTIFKGLNETTNIVDPLFKEASLAEIEDTFDISDVFSYLNQVIREFSTPINFTSTINSIDAVKNLPLQINISSAITSKETSTTLTTEQVIADDSGALKLNSYDTGDYFFLNANDYQSDVVLIT